MDLRFLQHPSWTYQVKFLGKHSYNRQWFVGMEKMHNQQEQKPSCKQK